MRQARYVDECALENILLGLGCGNVPMVAVPGIGGCRDVEPEFCVVNVLRIFDWGDNALSILFKASNFLVAIFAIIPSAKVVLQMCSEMLMVLVGNLYEKVD
jgi:hypothetical protein